MAMVGNCDTVPDTFVPVLVMGPVDAGQFPSVLP